MVMGTVAIVALVLACYRARNRMVFCQERAKFLSEEEERYLRVALIADHAGRETKAESDPFKELAESVEGKELARSDPRLFQDIAQGAKRPSGWCEHARICRMKALWCRSAGQLFERASKRPWQEIPAEPPFPEEPSPHVGTTR
jgi:hypothetical protein